MRGTGGERVGDQQRDGGDHDDGDDRDRRHVDDREVVGEPAPGDAPDRDAWVTDAVRDAGLIDVANVFHLQAYGFASTRTGWEAPFVVASNFTLVDPDGRTHGPDLIALDVEFHRAIYQLAGNPVIEETITPQWPHMRRSMATVLSELDYRGSAWAEHADIAGHILAGDAKAAERAALAHAQTAGRMTEERLRATEEAAA